MRKLTCKKTKDEILNIIIEEFEKVKNGKGPFDEYKYLAYLDLLAKLVIYEKE